MPTVPTHSFDCVDGHSVLEGGFSRLTGQFVDVLSGLWCELLPLGSVLTCHFLEFTIVLTQCLKLVFLFAKTVLVEVNCGHKVRVVVFVVVHHLDVTIADAPVSHHAPVYVVELVEENTSSPLLEKLFLFVSALVEVRN